MTDRQSFGILSISVAAAAVLLFSHLGTIPGLHGDEAWVGLRAHAILQGARPLIGMNTNTGPIHQYFVALLLALLGYKIAVLRYVTAVACLVTIVLYYRIVQRLFDRTRAAVATMLLVTMPFFTLFGRLAGENFALNP
ncbi:MAG TPA: glycosyltransferase family 39 protein, partial [Vicinamibacterales bacterium]|nr:glycosyltransferase family 39 protein [Vicinamibacterales bacterium]